MSMDRIRPAHSLLEFFQRRLHREIEHLGLEPPPQEDTVWYLCDMLGRFSRSEHLFDYFDGRYGVRPLALIYGDALAAPSDQERCQLLQRLGELALFVGAFLRERYRRWGIRRDYFIGMGSGAYEYLAGHAPGNRHVYDELTRQFDTVLELVSAAGEPDPAGDPRRVMALYQQWLRTRDPAIAARLRRLGVGLA